MESLLKLLAGAMKFLGMVVPPRMNQNGHTDLIEKSQKYEFRIRRWRWAVFVSIVLLVFSFTTNVVLSWGYEPYVEGFVRKSEYEKAEAMAKQSLDRNVVSIQRIEVRLLTQDLLATRVGQCRSTDKSYFTNRLEELMQEYQMMTNREWRVPDCSQVVPDE